MVVSALGNIWQYRRHENLNKEAWNKYRQLNSAFAGLTAKSSPEMTDSEAWHRLSRKINDLGYFLADPKCPETSDNEGGGYE
jgi:hypothetical protein